MSKKSLKNRVIRIAGNEGMKESRVAGLLSTPKMQVESQKETTTKFKKPEGKRPRVAEVEDRWSFEELTVGGSWGYVAPGPRAVAYYDPFTIGVVVGSGAEREQPELPRYIFRWDTECRNYTVVRDFGLALARRFMRRFGSSVRGVSLMRGDCVVVETGYYDEVEFVRFDHIASKEEFREWLKQFN